MTPPKPTNRRAFIRRAAGTTLALTGAPLLSLAEGSSPGKYRAAVIGHTGRGDYGHGHDTVFNHRADVTVVAVADPQEEGRRKAAERSGARRQYSDYREMLDRERPELVSIAPRWTDQHYAIAMAALESGAHVYMEKPFTQTLAQADALLAMAQTRNLRIAVAHQMRLAPNILFLKTLLEAGRIGQLLEMRSHGKQDHRAGGEDLIVLGVHIFDLMRFFAGDASWCAALVLVDGREVTRSDAREATEAIGPVIGNQISAAFAFPNGVQATFTSRAGNADTAGPWGIELIGTKGRLRILLDIVPRVFTLAPGTWTRDGRTDQWMTVPGDPLLTAPDTEKTLAWANRRVVDDWMDSILQRREPVCSGYAGMKALEMAHAVFAAGLARGRVGLPLAARSHPLASD